MKRNLWTWVLYDAGNSFLDAAIGGLYLAQWVVLDNNLPDIWYGGTFVTATILVLLLSPILGAWSDRLGKRLPFIKLFTIILYLATMLMILVASSSIQKNSKVFVVLMLFLVIQTLYQLSLVSYNALLEILSNPGNRGKISGLGSAFNNIGWIVAAAVLLPFAEIGRLHVFLPALIGFIVLTLPMLIWFKEADKPVKKSVSTMEGLKQLFTKNKNTGIFLLGFSFVSDALLTIALYFAIAMNAIYGISDRQKFLVLLIIFVANIISNYILGLVCDKKGAKKVLIYSCVLMLVVFLVGFGARGNSLNLLYAISVFIGISWGGFYTAARALMIKISPQNQLGEYFGLYSTFQRFASIAGPLIWGGITLALIDYPILKYRVAGFSLVALIAIGVLILNRVKDEPAAGLTPSNI